MSVAEEVRSAFPDGVFGAPATESSIDRAQQELRIVLPEVFRELYLAFDGFTVPGGARYLLPLQSPSDGHVGLVSWTKFLWTEEWAPASLRSYFYFGMSTSDRSWGYSINPPQQMVEHHYSMSREAPRSECSPLELWRADKLEYERAVAAPAVAEHWTGNCAMCRVSLDIDKRDSLPYCAQ